MSSRINLLPPDIKQEHRYARRNARLLHTLTLFGVGLAGMLVIVAAGLVYMQQVANDYRGQAKAAEARLQGQKQAEIEKQARDVSNDLKLAVQVLSKEILFSELLKQLAMSIPNNVSLRGISISELKGALDITAEASDITTATQLQVNLTDPSNKIFSKADIISINCSSGGTKRYPCDITVRALFAEGNPYLFISKGVR